MRQLPCDAVDARVRRERDEARVRLRMVADVASDGRAAECSRSARSPTIAASPGSVDSATSAAAVGRRRRRDRPARGIDRSSPRHCSSATGCERTTRIVLQRRSARARRGGGGSGSTSRATIESGRLVEQVVRLVDRPGERALDRQHAVRRPRPRPSPRSRPRTCPRRRARTQTGRAARPPRRCGRRRRPRMRRKSSPAQGHVEAATRAVRLGGPLVLGALPRDRLARSCRARLLRRGGRRRHVLGGGSVHAVQSKVSPGERQQRLP